MLYEILIQPIEDLFDMVFYTIYDVFSWELLALLTVSIVINIVTLPLYRMAEKMRAEAGKKKEALGVWETHIRKTFRGDERSMMLGTYYRMMNRVITVYCYEGFCKNYTTFGMVTVYCYKDITYILNKGIK